MDNNKIFAYILKEEKGYFIDSNGVKIIDINFQSGNVFSGKYLLGNNKESLSVMNMKGDVIWHSNSDYDISPSFCNISEDVLTKYVSPIRKALPTHRKKNTNQELFEKGFVYLVDLVNGKELMLTNYIWCGEMHEGLVPVAHKSNRTPYSAELIDGAKWGFINKDGVLVIGLNFDYVSDFSEGKAAVKQDKKWFYINKSGNRELSGAYDDADIFHHGLAIVSINNKYGLIDKMGNLVFTPVYGKLDYLREGIYKATKYNEAGNEKTIFALLNGQGVLLSDFLFDEIYLLGEDKVIAKINGQYCISNSKGEVIKELNIDEVVHSNKGRVTVKVNGKLGMIDADGNWVIQPECDFISEY